MKSYSHSKATPAPLKAAVIPDPTETAQEAIHQVMSKTDAKAVKAKTASKQTVAPPMKAAKGDDDLMSAPQKKS